ncbi:conserved hypothetical protein [Hahella chejuensis KCTC 2396]|uniref:4-oxalocrotonate tautomerase n=1 Tax=Hahella chejuensis (strain KCTC 2396) TaxID=349521 RepID=Q2SAP6_HAHCH|nr:4-oxalocrotonate tautomerase [Hahella chejuensis]ABC32278.1 conserved hypothetical protein [Hahella chejuensis KCTC 2396]
MPLTITLTEGVLPPGAEQEAVVRITDAMLKWHNLTGNNVMTPNVTATVHVLPKQSTFAGGKPVAGAWIEWKTPSFAFNDQEIRRGFFAEATQVIQELSGGKQPKENIYVNVTHAVDGAWSLNGQAVSNLTLLEAVAAG